LVLGEFHHVPLVGFNSAKRSRETLHLARPGVRLHKNITRVNIRTRVILDCSTSSKLLCYWSSVTAAGNLN
jgi:hypothetical protein